MSGLLSRVLFGRFARGESYWDTPNGMNENLRVLDDHVYIPADLIQTSASALPAGATNGYTVIETDTGKMHVWFDGGFTTYAPARGKVAVSGDDLFYNVGTAWQSLDTKVANALQSFDPAALATFCDAVRACAVGTRLKDCNDAVIPEGANVPTCAQAAAIAAAAASGQVTTGIATGDGPPDPTGPQPGKLPLYIDKASTPQNLYLWNPPAVVGQAGAWHLVGDGNDSGANALFEVFSTSDLSGTGKPGDPLSVNFPTPPPAGIQAVTLAAGALLSGNGTPGNGLNLNLPGICSWLVANCPAISAGNGTTFSIECEHNGVSAYNRSIFIESSSPATFILQQWSGSNWVNNNSWGSSISTSTLAAPPGATATATAVWVDNIGGPIHAWFRLVSQTGGVSSSEPIKINTTCPAISGP